MSYEAFTLLGFFPEDGVFHKEITCMDLVIVWHGDGEPFADS